MKGWTRVDSKNSEMMKILRFIVYKFIRAIETRCQKMQGLGMRFA